MKKRTILFSLLLVFGAVLAACSGRTPLAGDLEETVVSDYASFVSALEQSGSSVSSLGELTQDFVPVTGQRVEIDGVEIQVYEFADEAAASAFAESISPEGSAIGTTMVTWIEPPHFYRSGQLVALYLGSEAKVTSLLSSLLGEQIAGGPTP